MNTTALKVNNHYPEEEFDHQQQKDWVRAVVDRMVMYSAAAVHTAGIEVRNNSNWRRAV